MTGLVAEQTIESKANESSSTVIEVKNLSKHFVKGSNVAAVDDVSFSVGREVVTLLGPSGCGKTTTLRCIAGLERPDSGEILIDGRIMTSVEKKVFVPPEKRNIGLVFQSYALWPHMKVFDNTAYGLRVRHKPKAEIKARVAKALERVGLQGYEDRYPAQLSGGQQQRVALARSLVYEPKVLLLDEPLSNLDAKIRERTRIELKGLLTNIGISSVYVTHDQEEAFLLSDKIVVMNRGRVAQFDTPYKIYNFPAGEFVATFVGRTNMLEGKVVSNEDGKGVIQLLGSFLIRCRIPSSLSPGENCTLIIRSNEIGLSDEPRELSDKGPLSSAIPCEIISREYKGAVTDHVVKVGDTSLVVTTHKFCELGHVHNGEERQSQTIKTTKAFLEIIGESVTVVPKLKKNTQ